MNKQTIDISALTILKVIGILLLLWFLWSIKQVLVLLFVVMILVSALSPIVEKLHKQKVPRFLAVLLIYLFFGGIIFLLFYLILPIFISQTRQLIAYLPILIAKISPIYHQISDYLPLFQQNLQGIVEVLNKYSSNIWLVIINLFGGILSFFTVLVLTFYFLVGRESVKQAFVSYLPPKWHEIVLRIARKVGNKMGAWLRGQIVLCLLIGLMSYIALVILRIPYALILAVIAGILEIIPTIGPIISAIPAALIAFWVSPFSALIVVLAYLGIQQLESQIIAPKLFSKIIGLSPIIIIIALLIGAKLLGIVGAILAIPTALAIQVLVKEIRG